MKELVISTILVLIVTLGYSQDTYPKLIVIDSDTLVGITQQQSRDINRVFIEWGSCIEISDSLQQKVSLLKEKVIVDSLTIIEKVSKVSIVEELLSNEKLISSRLKSDLVDTDRELKREQERGVRSRWVAKVSTTVAVLSIIFILVK